MIVGKTKVWSALVVSGLLLPIYIYSYMDTMTIIEAETQM